MTWMDEAQSYLEAQETARRKTNKIETLQTMGILFDVFENRIVAYPYRGRKVIFEYDGERLVREIAKERFRRRRVVSYQ